MILCIHFESEDLEGSSKIVVHLTVDDYFMINIPLKNKTDIFDAFILQTGSKRSNLENDTSTISVKERYVK